MNAMTLLKQHGLIFGTSICYTSKNIETVTSDEFIDLIIENGCRYALYFHYMPVGNDADVSLLPSVSQRKYIYKRVREIRDMKHGKGLFTMDFQNDAAVSQVAGTISISMPMAMQNLVYLSTIRVRISVPIHC